MASELFLPQIQSPDIVKILTPPQSSNSGILSSEWVGFPIDDELILVWKSYDKDDSQTNDHWRTGLYLTNFVVEIARDANFGDRFYAIDVNAKHNPNTTNGQARNYNDIYYDMKSVGTGPLQTYTHTIPANTMKASGIYYLRIRPVFFRGHTPTDEEKENNLIPVSPQYSEARANTSFTIKTELNDLSINEFFVHPTSFDEFGGNVEISWDVSSASSVILRPTTISGFGSVASKGELTVLITESTDITIEAKNESGKVTKTQPINVAKFKGITPIFDCVLGETFDSSTIKDSDFVARAGETYNLQLYTEYIRDAKIFVAYPFYDEVNKTGYIKKFINVTIDNSLDEVTKPIALIIPDTEIITEKNRIVSGAWGYDAIGKDNKPHGKVCGYFKLIT